ncbi:DEAD/DEAH box helicase family protein [Streptomyces sp. NPDC048251]|uniref:DEAD/DEAH box helicase family protein n=1 Tax=Streptomyces sp. NPDC048251 TaxID=3154501 RepID=UPI00344A1868
MNDRSTPVHGRKSGSRIIPRPHQEEAPWAIRETSEGRALVVMACGTGKSLVARETANARTASTARKLSAARCGRSATTRSAVP